MLQWMLERMLNIGLFIIGCTAIFAGVHVLRGFLTSIVERFQDWMDHSYERKEARRIFRTWRAQQNALRRGRY